MQTDFGVIKEDDEYLKTIKKSGLQSPIKITPVNKINIIPNKKQETTKNKSESLTDR
jgi:hypothetical protein